MDNWRDRANEDRVFIHTTVGGINLLVKQFMQLYFALNFSQD
jgi:hypothetical protein